MTPIALNIDGSLEHQPRLTAQCAATLDLSALENSLRLRASKKGREALAEKLRELRSQFPDPWLTYYGSGDFHHLSLSLLQSLSPPDPFTLILIDNHPDWFKEWPTHHCGNWVSGALKLPNLSHIIMIGQDSEDLRPSKYFTAPFRELTTGKVTLHPLQRESVKVPRWAKADALPDRAQRHWWGTKLNFQTVYEVGVSELFREVAEKFAGQNIYISIDKDCLDTADAIADWEQGGLRTVDVAAGVRGLVEHCNIIGADICGEHAARPLEGLIKRADAGRLFIRSTPCSDADRQKNERTNLALMEAFRAS